ncbi:hypothetical protein ISTM_123 [Insectomime virus]|uniref:Uncharacterized protein n=1 Tax=Tunisvirus fontaine2 TaxID=1421067 RepID=V9SF22_9VIRU|nr:hypothetical protein D1R32_gp199 [Tunisvirus fontaine2]AHA46021.1 hypothetical protein ISTM_123 [Insectomime virus]AHC54916.1 hypothetical protein TNS_ORF198 [Tunisvirus fontaine2]
MEQFNSYFQSLQFYLVEQKAIGGSKYSVYAAKISSLLADGQRYVLLFVPASSTDVAKSHISMLQWESLQTRILPNNYNIPLQTLNFQRNKQDILQVFQRTPTCTYYSSPEIPVEVALLHNPKKRSIEQFPDRLQISQALSTFSCVVKVL